MSDDDREFSDSGLGSDALEAGWDDLEPPVEEEGLDEFEGIDELDDPPHDGHDPSAEAGRPRRGVRVVLATGRALSGAILLGLAAVLIGGLSLLPLPSLHSPAQSTTVLPEGVQESRVCPGAPLLLANDEATNKLQLTELDAAVGSFDAEAGVSAQTLNTPDVADTALPGPGFITMPDDADPEARLAGSQIASPNRALTGLVAAACTPAEQESWLVGGATTTGRTSLVILGNPSTLDARVRLTVYGQAGEIAESPEIIVSGTTQRVVSLAGYAPGEESPVVRVFSEGAPVSAQLQQGVVRTLEPGGIDTLPTGRAPWPRQVIPGVPVTTAKAVESLFASPGFDDLRTVVRVFVPVEPGADPRAVGDENRSTVTVRVVGEGSDPFIATVPMELERGVVTDIPLDALPENTYTVTVEGAQPLLAAVRVSTVSGRQTDFSWRTAAPPLGERAMAVVTPGPSSSLSLAATGDSVATVTLSGPDGERTVQVPPGGVTVSISAGTTILQGSTGVVATVGYQRPGGIAGFPLIPLREAPAEVTVYR